MGTVAAIDMAKAAALSEVSATAIAVAPTATAMMSMDATTPAATAMMSMDATAPTATMTIDQIATGQIQTSSRAVVRPASEAAALSRTPMSALSRAATHEVVVTAMKVVG